MRTAIFADLHDNSAGLSAVLDDAVAHKVDNYLFLGDAGHTPRVYASLQARQIPAVFGNWEVSGLARLQPPLVDWVKEWPALIRRNRAVYCHATPEMPAGITTTASAVSALRPGMSWSALFPRLHRDEAARWHALAWLESHDLQVAFHGHTHVQMVWTWELEANRLRAATQQERIKLQPASRYLIGVGSAGAPDDGPLLRYAIYDEGAATVLLRRLNRG